MTGTLSLEGMTDTSLRARWKRRRRLIIPVIVVMAAAGAFAAWGPIGIGPGPIGNISFNGFSVAGPASRTQPTVFVVDIDAGDSGAVIDSIAVLSGGSYPAPHVLSVRGDGDLSCGGAYQLTGPQNFYAECAAGALAPLIGRPVPVSSHVNAPTAGPVTYPGTGAAIEAAPPDAAGCWMVTAVVIHYHVGIRHYTATHAVHIAACWSKSKLTGVQ